jgi:cytochrome c-type biogenesis protein CcmH
MRALILALSLALAAPALAVQPDEILPDPALEARARALSADLRCLVCRNESIDESNAPLARDLRILVRERLVAGDSDAEVMDFVVARYGEYVLLRPLQTGSNWLLWAAGPAALVLGLGLSLTYLRRRRIPEAAPVDGLSEAEQKRLNEILRD